MRYIFFILIFCSWATAINYHGCTLASDNLHGWVVCTDTTLILHTVNGGLTWSPQSVPPDTINRKLFDVTCVDEMNAWTTGKHNLHAAEILATTDGGNVWFRQIAGFSKYGTRIEFLNDNYGIAVGGDGALAVTTDGGGSWDQVFTDWYEAEYYGVSIVSQWDSWICAGWPDSLVSGQGYIVPTYDGGLTWDTVNGYHATGYEDFFDIHMFNLFDGIVVGGYENTYDPIIWKTTDGGSTWNPISAPANTYYLRALDFVDQQGWAVGKSGTIIHTTDGGNTWTTQTSPADSTLFDVDFSDAQHGLACGYDYILRTTNGGQDWQHVGIEELTTDISTSITLSISPNPFKQETQIRYTIQDTGSIEELRNSDFEMRKPSIRIYDATGRLVKSFNLESRIENHESSFVWNGTDDHGKRMPAGIYFVELSTTDHTVCDKIVLLE
jgi:photosystem II stability/assembly factor-like uncharacterized protein